MPMNTPALVHKPFTIPQEELLERYEKLYTAALNDVMRDMGYLECTLPAGLIPLVDGQRTAGIVYTVKTIPLVTDMPATEVYKRKGGMIGEIHKDAILCYDTTGDMGIAAFGDIMTAAALSRGARGVVIDGAIRDIKDVKEMGFKAWARVKNPNVVCKYRQIIYDWQIPILIGNVVLHPGDVLLMDEDGGVCVPREIAEEVLFKGEALKEKETGWRKLAITGMDTAEYIKMGGGF